MAAGPVVGHAVAKVMLEDCTTVSEVILFCGFDCRF
jgi:hypothetical protein